MTFPLGKGRYDLLCEQLDRPLGLGQRDITKGHVTDEVVDAGALRLRGDIIACLGRGAGKADTVVLQDIEFVGKLALKGERDAALLPQHRRGATADRPARR